jgi:hypothetical protein
VKKLSAAMRTVDEETRRIVMQNRIDALEADNLFQNIHNPDEEAELDDEISRKKGVKDNEEFIPEEVEQEESEDIDDS